MVSKLLKADCHVCQTAMSLCDVPYSKWVELGADEREEISKGFLRLE
ncbi:MAG: hypothetical protein HFI66_00175 [Lachnospiraceae bacterium]|jgi:hypothetical protein|nr:hypothetical protein [Lachnospiraceae bacterium]